MTQVSVSQSQSYIVCTPPLSAEQGVGGLSLQPNFKKWRLDRTSTFRGGLREKRGVPFFEKGGWGVELSHNKLKSEIFNDTKGL